MAPQGTWPFPGDNEAQRARTIAQAYRNQLHAAAPQLCRLLDERMRAFGQLWIINEELAAPDDQPVTTAEAAMLVSVRQETIRQWACTPHPDDPQRMVLPRYDMRGRHRTYLAGDVRTAANLMRRGMRARKLRAVA